MNNPMTAQKFLRVIKRDETLEFSDPLADDTPNFTREERQCPVKVELMRPIEVHGEKQDFVVAKPSTLKQIQRFGRTGGSTEGNLLTLICQSVSLPKKVVLSMLPSDYKKLQQVLLEFSRNHIHKLKNATGRTDGRRNNRRK